MRVAIRKPTIKTEKSKAILNKKRESKSEIREKKKRKAAF